MELYPRDSKFPFLSRDSISSARQVNGQASGGNPLLGEAKTYQIVPFIAEYLFNLRKC